MATLTGVWTNQYDSEVRITDQSDGNLIGTFRTAIETSPYAGHDVPLKGESAWWTSATTNHDTFERIDD